jgi:hypothetical protein
LRPAGGDDAYWGFCGSCIRYCMPGFRFVQVFLHGVLTYPKRISHQGTKGCPLSARCESPLSGQDHLLCI